MDRVPAAPAASGFSGSVCRRLACLPGLQIVASTVPTGTFWPASTLISPSTPSLNTSISIAPFCVSTSAMMSPRFRIARPLVPLDERAGVHVGAERWHLEFDHFRSAFGGRLRR